jgi:ubiquinone/menaquinone biosynthesis C-methylase UbiE
MVVSRVKEVDRILREYERREREIPVDFYSPTHPANLFFRQSRERAVLQLLGRSNLFPLHNRRVLDVGCGTGQWLVDFETWGADRANLAGIDLVPSRVEQAAARLSGLRDESGRTVSPGADIRLGDASRLPWEDDSFDLVVQSMAFSSILDQEMRRNLAREMARVVAPGGVILWYDFSVDNPRNPHVRGVRTKEILALFPGFTFESQRITLLPPLARRVAGISVLAAELLTRMRFLNTHILAVLRSPQ